MNAYMKRFTPSKKSVPDPNGGMINYPEICIDTNPHFEHKLTAHEIIILDQAAQLEQVTAEREAMREALVNYMIYDTCDGYEKLAERFGACEHPESSVWMEDWKNLVLREPAAAALKGGKG